MNPFGSSENVVIDGVTVNLPVLIGQGDIFSPKLTFKKPSWMPDDEATSCLNCSLKFSQLRRKHHCRNCGKIFCYKCCSEKMCLPHYGMNDPEKVCNNCKLIVELMTKSKSHDELLKYEAISGLSSLTKNVAGLCKVIECGGIHIMFSMGANGDAKMRAAVASALHDISQNMVLNTFLVEAGCLKLLKILMVPSGSGEFLGDCLSALNLLCMDANLRIEVLKEGIVESLLSILHVTGTVAVFAARVLLLLVSCFDHQEFILKNHPTIIKDLFDALQDEDFQMQTCISKMLVYFSAGSDPYRQLIIQEDVSKGFPLLYLLKGSCRSVLVNTACIVANISLAVNQNYSHEYITGMCELVNSVEEGSELLMHLGRGLANFAECPSNSLHLIHHLPTIISRLLKSDAEVPRVHACRLIICLFSSEPTSALDALSQCGIGEFLEIVFDLPGITDMLNKLLLRKVSRLSICH